MKTILLLLLLISSLHGNDPTELKGKLKDALNKFKEPTPPQKKTKTSKTREKTPKSNLQKDINLLIFKAFYTKNLITRLMLEFENKINILEVGDSLVLRGEIYRLQSFNQDKAQFLHVCSNLNLTFTYRP